MRVLIHPAAARQRFREIVQLPEPALDLVEGSLVIALEEHPSLDIGRYLGEVNDWSDAVCERIAGRRDIEHVIAAINRILFEEEGFHGEDEDYYDPRSALLNETLDRHAGLPYGGGVRYREQHLRSFSRREILGRELAQLKAAYLAQHDIARAAASVDRLLILDERDAFEVRDRAALAMQLHAYSEAVECLERYLALMPHADDRGRVREQILYLRAWMEQN